MNTSTYFSTTFQPPHAGRGVGGFRIILPLLLVGFSVVGARASGPPLELRSPDGRRQVRAVQIDGAITLDGSLNEEAWTRATPADGFVQAEPQEGQAATEATEVRVLFDRDMLYVGVQCHDSAPSGLMVNDIRKDFLPDEEDSFEVLLDTFADRRNGFVFITNPRGAKADTQIANEGREVNTSWDAVWWVVARIGDHGWSAELRIPFKTLRFEPGADRLWGINFARRIRRKNEIDYWSPVPRAYTIYRASLDGNLIGLPDLSQGRNLRLKPFLSASATRPTGETDYDGKADLGLDVKYGVTPSLTLDVTIRPDFAQAEADEQQVNLTQFSLFYPEKREFFLENSGVFYFGDIPRNSRSNSRFRPPEEELLLFFSRRIGLTDDGQQIPILGGARLTGRAAGFGVGAMTMQTKSADGIAGDNYTVLRLRRDLLKNSDVGVVGISRQSAQTGSDYNRLLGVDANFRFRKALSINTFLVRSMSPGQTDGQWSAKGSVGWEDNLVHAQYSLLSIGDNFRDDIGFVRRTGVRKHFVDFGLRPRPDWLRRHGFREAHPHFRINHFTNQSNVTVTREYHVGQSFYFERGGLFEFYWNPRMERIFTPFEIHSGVTIPAGAYPWNEFGFVLETDHSRVFSGSARVIGGGFWSGTQRSAQLALTVRPSYRLLVDIGLQRNDIRLRVPQADFVTTLLTTRIGYSFNTRMFLDALLQYNADKNQFSSNVRFNLIHRPLSDLFVVYNEQRMTDDGRVPAGRGLIVKYTHMLSF